jgi:general secretion pathway protein A
MYTEFYHLKEKPFNLTPSPRSLYLGDIHREALALLTYGVIDRKGFILLTGEVGTGKTTMVHALLSSLGEGIHYVYLSNPLFSVNDFMNYLAFSAFKQKMDFKNKTDFLIHFETFLKKQLVDQKNFILIIDEAQKLSFELLEEIRLLSNLETSEEKLINIFLVGQPELNDLLNQPRCRPLLQRISIRYHIKALDELASIQYISTKLKLAGATNAESIIPKSVGRAIYRYSDGYPRMINILADNALLLGYARGDRHITTAMVKECYDDLQLEGSVFNTIDREKPVKNKRKGLFDIVRDFKWAAIIIMILLICGFIIDLKGNIVTEWLKILIAKMAII